MYDQFFKDREVERSQHTWIHYRMELKNIFANDMGYVRL